MEKSKNSFSDAVATYKQSVDSCVFLANDIISSRANVDLKLRFYKMNIASFRLAVLRVQDDVPEKVDLLNELFFLEQAAVDLNVSVDEAMLMALNSLSLCFDKVSAATRVVRELIQDDCDHLMPVLHECQQNIDDVFTRLVECFAVKPNILNVMGISLVRCE